MNRRQFSTLTLCLLTLAALPARADEYSDTVNLFKKAVESREFFDKAYGYAVFPTIGKGGIGIGGAYGSGQVYEKGRLIGSTSMSQLSVGFQLGAQGFSQIIFFENAAALQTFTRAGFEFGAEASAVAITLAAGAKANTAGTSVGVSGTKNDAKTAGLYYKGMATFTIAKGGLMYEATISGQKFEYKPR